MAQQVNKCLRSVFVTYNSVLLGLLIIGIALMLVGGAVTWVPLVGGLIQIGIISLGIFGARQPKTWALVVYSVLVSLGVLIYLICGVMLVANHSGEFEVGIAFAIAVIWFVGVAMAVPLLCQMTRQDNTNAAV